MSCADVSRFLCLCECFLAEEFARGQHFDKKSTNKYSILNCPVRVALNGRGPISVNKSQSLSQISKY